MSYLFNNPQGLKGDLTVAGQLTANNGLYVANSSNLYVDEITNWSLSTDPVAFQVSAVALQPISSVDREPVSINPIDSGRYYVVASAPLTSTLLKAPKIKVTLDFFLQTDDGVNNSSYLIGWSKSLPVGNYAYDPAFNQVATLYNFTSQISAPVNALTGSIVLVFTKGVEYLATDTSIGLDVGGTIAYPNSRAIGSSVGQVLIEPLW